MTRGGWLLAYALLCASLFPAFLGVLAITHSPLQSLSPVALARFLGKSGGTIWIASAFLLLGGFALSALDGLPTAFRLLSLLAFGYAFASLVGSLIIGQAETFGKAWLPGVSMLMIYVVMALVVLLRPQGLFGRPLK